MFLSYFPFLQKDRKKTYKITMLHDCVQVCATKNYIFLFPEISNNKIVDV